MSHEEVLQNILNGLNYLKNYCENQLGSVSEGKVLKSGDLLTVKEISDKYLFCSEGTVYDLLREGHISTAQKDGKLAANENEVLRRMITKKGRRSFFAMRRHYKLRPEFKQKIDEILKESGLSNPF